jgi:hypothetical protein
MAGLMMQLLRNTDVYAPELWVLKFRYAPNSLDISSLRLRPHTS